MTDHTPEQINRLATGLMMAGAYIESGRPGVALTVITQALSDHRSSLSSVAQIHQFDLVEKSIYCAVNPQAMSTLNPPNPESAA